MNKFFKVFFFFAISFTIHAQDAAKAKNILDDVSAQIKTYKNIVIDFKYTLSNPKENINQESNGNVAIENVASGKYNLNFMGVSKIFDGSKVYTIVPEDEEVTISKFDDSDDNAITPSKMLTFFTSGHKYAMDILQNVKGRKIQYVKLVPISSKDQRKEILIGIDVQTKNIYNIIETGKNGTKTILTVNSFKTNQPLSKNHFTFTQSKYANYYINRLD
uniref:LolA family protein n=1 Tax=Flavobacterium sp. TaxID=239 RepID=UPI004049CF2A